MKRLAWILGVSLASSCGGQGEPISQARYVTYLERTRDGYIIVDWFPDEECKLRILMGPTLNDLELTGKDPRCNTEELALGEDLLNYDAWQTYSSVNCEELPPLDGPAVDENGTPQSTANYPVGCIEVERITPPGFGVEMKRFDANTTGPEAAVIAYFRKLQNEYGRD